MHIAIVPGHGWRVRKGQVSYDPGASYGGEREADIVRRVAALCEQEAPDRVSVHDSEQSRTAGYTERREAAQAAIGSGPGVVLHLHVNAGKGDYLMAMYDHRSVLGGDYAEQWCRSADRILRPLFRADVRERPQPSRPDDWTSRAYSLLRGSYSETPAGVAALLLEPGFIDSDSHDGLWAERGITLQARAILDAFL